MKIKNKDTQRVDIQTFSYKKDQHEGLMFNSEKAHCEYVDEQGKTLWHCKRIKKISTMLNNIKVYKFRNKYCVKVKIKSQTFTLSPEYITEAQAKWMMEMLKKAFLNGLLD
jgi:hypothetical protein